MNYCSEKNISITEICNILIKKINDDKKKLLFKYSKLKKTKKTIFASKHQKHFKKLKDKYFNLELKKLIQYTRKLTMSNSPLFSIIPTFNQSSFLEKALILFYYKKTMK